MPCKPKIRRLRLETLENRQLLSITTLTVANSQSFARTAEPVASGVPVPASLGLYDTSHLRITDASGQTVPAQFDVLGRWNSGPQDVSAPIRWVEVQFAANVPASSSSVYQLSDDGTGNASGGITASENADVIDVTTGPARFQINRHSFNLFDSVWLDLNHDGTFESNEQIVTPSSGNGSFVDQAGTQYQSSAAAPISATLEETCPLRTTIRVEGFHADPAGTNLLRYVTWLTFYAGQSYVKVDHTLIEGRVAGTGNDWGVENQQQTAVDDAGLRLHVALSGAPQVSIRGAQDAVYQAALAAGDSADIIQHRSTNWQDPMSYETKHGAATVEAGTQATRAWLDVSDSRWGLAVGTRDFWQKNPEALVARADSNGAGGTVQVEFPAEPYTYYQAMGLGDEAIFYFHAAGIGAQGIAPVLEGFSKDPMFVVAPPAWMVASGAFGEVPASPAPAAFAQLDQAIQQDYDQTMQFIHDGKSYGLLNYLDMPVDAGNVADDPNQTNWGNSYYDAPSAEIRQFARTGDYRWVSDLAFPQIRHFYTTDMYDTDDPTSYQNGISGAVGPYHREGWTGEYNYMESLWNYYYLTGDPRAKERGAQAAQTYATNPMWAVDADLGFGPGLTTRISSQKLHTMLEGWLATGDAALKVALDAQMHDYLTHMFTPEGFLVDRYQHDNPYTADQGFMVAILMHDTVYQYYLATGDALAKNFVVTAPQRIAQYQRVSSDKSSPDYYRFYNQVEVTPNGAGGFTASPVFPNGNSDDYLYIGGKFALATALARAGKVAGDATLLAQARDLLMAVMPQWTAGVWDKPTAQEGLRVMQGVAIVSAGTGTALNNPPVLAPLGNQTVNEGRLLTFKAMATDPDVGETLSFSLDAGAPAGAAIDPASGVFTWTPHDGPGSYSITVRATDNGSPALSDAKTLVVTVLDVPPTATFTGGPAVEGQPAVIRFSNPFDPSPAETAAGFKYSYDFNNRGVFDVVDTSQARVSHTFSEEGSYTVRGRIKDKDGAFTDYTTVVTVNDASMAAVGKTITVKAGAAFSGVVATFKDQGGAETPGDYSAKIKWGDGATQAGAITSDGKGGFVVAGQHTYAKKGNYRIDVTIVHEHGVSATASGTAKVSGASAHGDPGANQAYVAALYVDVLGHPADPAGLDYWTSQVNQTAAPDKVAAPMVHSDDYFGNSVITPAFQRLLGRAPDAAGLAYWTDQMQLHGLTDERLEAALIGAAEFYQRAGGNDMLWVDAMYFDLLGRAPDPQGESYWVQQLAGGADRGNVAYSIAAGSERERQRITDDYMRYLGRSPDEQGLAFWIKQFASGVSNEDLIAGFVASDEYYQKQTTSLVASQEM